MTTIDDAVIDDLFAVKRIAEPEIIDPAIADLFTTHTHACIDCGQPYQTCNPSPRVGRCSRCIITRIGAPAATDARITCRVCGAQATVGLDRPALLCPLCLSDIDATRARHAAQFQAALMALDANQAQWNARRLASPAQARWEDVQAALIGVAEKRVAQRTFDATWTKRKAEPSALAQLLLAYEEYARECDRLSEELARLDAAQREINAAWLTTEV